MKKKELITLIIPCLNEEESIDLFYEETEKIIKQMDYVKFEYVFVDDGSTDKTLTILRKLAKKDKKVKYLSFSRNFGKEAAMLAGLKKSTGDLVAIMDVDLQDPPEKLIDMYKEIKAGYDCAALYTKTHHGYKFIRKFLTNLWYKIINKLSSNNKVPGERDFRLMKRKVVNAIIDMPEYNRYIKGMYDFVGFKTKWLEYDAPKRKSGTSKFNLKKLIKYAVEGVIAYSTSLLLLSAYVGLLLCLISFILIIIIILKTVIWGDSVAGWPSMACLITFLGGVQLFFLGVIGLYLSKIYLEVKQRPIYIVEETEESINEKNRY